MNLIYQANNKMYLMSDDESREIPSQRVKNYIEVLRSIQSRNEWKTTGEGAKFMGYYEPTTDISEQTVSYSLTGIDFKSKEEIVYSIQIGNNCGIYTKEVGDNSIDEGLVLSKNNFSVSQISCKEDQLVGVIEELGESHLVIINMENGNYGTITEGDSREEYPSWATTKNGIYFSGSGLARNEEYAIIAESESKLCYLDLDTNEIEELIGEEGFNYIKPKEDSRGNIYFIRRPNKVKRNILEDLLGVVLIPFRFIKAIGSFLNMFSKRYTGESLHPRQNNGAKAKYKDEKTCMIDGNLIRADQALKDSKKRKETYPGIIPKTWELLKFTKKGEISSIKKGVMEFAITNQNEIIYSNGSYLVKIKQDGSEIMVKKVAKVSKIIIEKD